MWLITTGFALAFVIAIWWKKSNDKEWLEKYRLDYLALMLAGTFIMVLVDHTIAFIEGEPFMTAETDGLIGSSVVLGIAMLVPIFIVWIALVLYSRKK